MILYVSNATAYPLFDRLFAAGKICSGYQMQKFNSNLIEGISLHRDIEAVSVLPYKNRSAKGIREEYKGVDFYCTPSLAGPLHKPFNLLSCFLALISKVVAERPECLIVDAVAKTPLYASLAVGRLFRIPVIGIVTDFLGMLDPENPENTEPNPGRMGECDAFVLLTEQMNCIVNPMGKPYIVVEGVASNTLPDLAGDGRSAAKTVFLYSGSLWKRLAGIEYFIEGFISAGLENAELHLYGMGELVPWIEDVSLNNPSVRYMGCVPNEEMVKLQSEADFLVNPRPSTGAFCKYSFPSKTIEYLSSGTPVLMTRLPGVPSEYFDYVRVIEPETSEGARESVLEAVSLSLGRRKDIGMEARRFIEERKSARMQAGRVVDFCDRVAKEFTA